MLRKKQLLPRAFEINSYKKIQELLSKQNFNKLKILQTGKGNVAKGSMEILKYANVKQISLNDYLNKKYDKLFFAIFHSENMLSGMMENILPIKILC